MKSLVVKNEDVKHKLAYQILGFFTYIFSIGFAMALWDEIFFDRHKWLTRKNVLNYLQSPHKIEYYKYNFNNDINLTFEDGSEICMWINSEGIMRDWSFHSKSEGNKCVLTGGLTLSVNVLDKQVKEILEGIRKKIEEIEIEKE